MFDNALFLDVGCHTGQTLDEVVRPIYSWRKIYAFEPMPRQFAHIMRAYRAFPEIQVFDYGLGDQTAAVEIYGSNESFESSIYAAKRDVNPIDVNVCTIVDASNWFKRHITPDDQVIMKLNCEGSEIPILYSLIDSGEIWKIHNVMIDFDIRKVAGMEHHEANLLARFREIGFDRYSLCDAVMVGHTHQDRIANWLRSIEQ